MNPFQSPQVDDPVQAPADVKVAAGARGRIRGLALSMWFFLAISIANLGLVLAAGIYGTPLKDWMSLGFGLGGAGLGLIAGLALAVPMWRLDPRARRIALFVFIVGLGGVGMGTLLCAGAFALALFSPLDDRDRRAPLEPGELGTALAWALGFAVTAFSPVIAFFYMLTQIDFD